MDESSNIVDPPQFSTTCGALEDDINISDVIEVIQEDPDFKQSNSKSSAMYNGGPDTENAPLQLEQPITAAQARRHCYVKIIEQPAPKALRFRYECEGRCAGSIPGVSSTPENKTYPAIQVIGYKGRAVVVVSCVTKDPPYRPHPHNLVGRDGCRKGVCTLEISPETMSVTFPNLGIQCVKKKDIESALRQREEIRVDPFRTGFSHRNQPTSIDLNAVRLCFQVFLEGERGRFTIPLTPVVSESIYDKKAMSDLVIVKLSDCVTTVDGGKKDIILLCEKVAKEDIQVRFYEEKENQVVWEGFADFQPSQVHKQTAIWFRPPRYRTLEITEPVKVYIQLRRPSDGSTSEPLPFQFLPLDSEPGMLKRKRQKHENDAKNQLLVFQLQEQETNKAHFNQLLNIPVNAVKVEPRDTSPAPYGGQVYGNPMYIPNASSPPQQQYRLPVEPLGPTPPPADMLSYHPNAPVTLCLDMVQQQSLSPMDSWNIPSCSNVQQQPSNNLGASNSMNFDQQPSNSGLSNLLDLDSQQTELRQLELNSSDLKFFDTNTLSENLSNNLSLSDVLPPDNNQNMTDSLTRLTNNTIDSICQLNELCKPTPPQ
ncbi:embryonic polarity protein dorsal isoform X3 [Agrilus planipennis]|uniref:Embryonic polarity protein dorsal isoform X3 n=1 Tax=Agrilus planipennis TaxID=224129 RepID=A0A1W4WSA8_AGRPL|nr:embryonic polarity protein dorsal isoform X3 [Agrilus planipennis]